MTSETVSEVIAMGKWASFVDHVKNNRLEYLLVMGLLHLVGFTNKAYDQFSGVCI